MQVVRSPFVKTTTAAEFSGILLTSIYRDGAVSNQISSIYNNNEKLIYSHPFPSSVDVVTLEKFNGTRYNYLITFSGEVRCQIRYLCACVAGKLVD